MSSVSSVNGNNSVAASGHSRDDFSNVSAFMYLAKALQDSASMSQKLFDSQSPEEREKQAILRQLQSINDLDEKQAMIKFLMKVFGKSGNTDLVAWLNGINSQIQNIIDDIKKIFSKMIQDDLKAIEKGEKRSKNKLLNVFFGDDETDNGDKKLIKLAEQRQEIIKNIQNLLSEPATMQTLTELQAQFSDLSSVISSEQKVVNDPITKFFKKKYEKAEDDKNQKTVEGPYGPYKASPSDLAWIFKKGESIGEFFDGQDFIKTIWKDSSKLINDSSLIIGESNLANKMLTGNSQVDINNLSSLIQKDTNAKNKYNSLMKDSLTDDSKLIAKVNYSNKV